MGDPGTASALVVPWLLNRPAPVNGKPGNASVLPRTASTARRRHRDLWNKRAKACGECLELWENKVDQQY